MPRYIVRRLLALIPVILGLTLVIFLLVNVIPGDTDVYKRQVLLCVDRAHPKKPERPICEEFYEDVGRWELVELMKAFGARLVFGSSNVRSDDNWDYIPFFAPVWRTEEPIGALLGYEGALTIANRLLKLAEGAP